MHVRSLRSLLLALAALALAQPAAAFLFVSGSNARSGDLVAVWIKNNTELIVNLGPVEALGSGPIFNLSVPAQFGGNLSGAKFTALAVPNPDAVYAGLGLDPAPPQPNVALTTLGDPLTISPVQVGDAQAVLDPPQGGQTWLNGLNAIPPAGTFDVIANDADEALIPTSLFASYTGNVGFASDAIANTLTLSTAITIDAGTTGAAWEVPLYTVFQTLTEQSGDFVFGTEVTELGTLGGDAGGSGLAVVSFLPAPEPGSIAAGLAALSALGGLAGRDRRRYAR